MERVNHVHIVQVGCGSLVGDVDGVLERHIPYGEGLELSVAGLDAALVLLIELTEANSHLAAAWARSCNNYQRAGGFHIIVLAEAFVGVDKVDVGGIALNNIMVIYLDANPLKPGTEGGCAALSVVMGDDNGAHQQSAADKFVAQSEHIDIVGDAEVVAHLVLLDVNGADDDDDFGVVTQLHQHAQLTVGLETGQDAAGMIVVKQLSAKLHVEFVAELGDSFLDVFRLDAEVLFVVKSELHRDLF